MKKLLLLLTAALIVAPFSVNADFKPTVTLKCNKTELVPGEKTTCSITGSSSEIVVSATADIVVGNSLTLGKVTVDEPWQGNGNKGQIGLYAGISDNIKSNFGIATFEITASSSAKAGTNTSVSLENVQLGDENFNGTELSVEAVSIKIVADAEPENPGGSGETPENPGETPENPGGSGETPENPGETPENPDDSDEDGKQDNPNTGDLSMYAIGTLAVIIAGVGIVASKKMRSM